MVGYSKPSTCKLDLDHRIEICKGIYNKEITIVSDRKSANADWSDAIFLPKWSLKCMVCLKGKAVGIVSKNTIISW
ncbi:hypothetical protein IYO2065_16050 [Lactiplantibacillus plantarum]|nr:hypothetical protein IYO2065_16050 [Lactiplantibacillus plantarum]